MARFLSIRPDRRLDARVRFVNRQAGFKTVRFVKTPDRPQPLTGPMMPGVFVS